MCKKAMNLKHKKWEGDYAKAQNRTHLLKTSTEKLTDSKRKNTLLTEEQDESRYCIGNKARG